MRKGVFYTVYVVLALVILSFPLAAGEDEKIHVEVGTIEGTRLSRGTARGFIPYPPDVVFRCIMAYDKHTEFMPHVVESRLLKQEGDSLEIYQKLNFPWPLENRWYRSLLTMDRQKGRLSWETVEGNLKSCTGYWDVQPVEGGSMVTYSVVLDPGRLYPAWAINYLQRRSLPEVVRALRDRIREEEGGGRLKTKDLFNLWSFVSSL